MLKEIHAILRETLACFLPGRAEDLSAPLYLEQQQTVCVCVRVFLNVMKCFSQIQLLQATDSLRMTEYRPHSSCGIQLKCDGTRRRTGGEVKRKMANGVGSQYSSHYLRTWCIQHYYR